MNIEIYSKTNCIFCDKAKMRLAKHKPQIFMLDKDFTREEFFSKFPNARTFPQIIINNEHIGTYDELERWLAFNNPDEDF
ncbi:glutaredoxin [Alphaproteobacteria bacterium]|nr:glutaredoxin [Alphaproteobacteria bacterium]